MERLLSALTAPAASDELAHFDDALRHYRAALGRPRPVPVAWRLSMPASLFGARARATVVGVAVGLGAVAVVAYAGSGRPDVDHVLQSVASSTTTATSSTRATGQEPAEDGVGPDAKGPAAFGLCNAWTQHQKHPAASDEPEPDADGDGGDWKKSAAFRNLANAAGGEARIGAYCATVKHPGAGVGNGGAKAKRHGTGKPDVPKSQKPKAHATGVPSTHPTGPPARHPTGSTSTHPTSTPSATPSRTTTTAPTSTATSSTSGTSSTAPPTTSATVPRATSTTSSGD
ncbi:hypothetical protein [Pedococcus sp. 5OH_020]|uniref:hypothetical protein n=1 Tax=Pedococcus sp. 5OH_020 TaxID=2989814 RepID=UPI0022E9B1A0|nr:hypothetical protein [Pedococcus sp. 5OH_020]